MILERLKEFAQRVELPREGYDLLPVSYTINLDKDGCFHGFIPLYESQPSKKAGKERLGKRIPLPTVEKTSGVKANLLSGNSEYVLGVPRKKEIAKFTAKGKMDELTDKVKKRFQAFATEVDECAANTKSPEVVAVQRFFAQSLDAARAQLPEKLDDSANFTFTVDGEYVAQAEAVAQYWAKKQDMMQEDEAEDENAGDASDENDESEVVVPTTCMLCESKEQIPLIHPKFKPIPGGQPSGVALISSNKQPFNSFGLNRAHIAPLCRKCSEPIHKALKWLIRSETHSFTLAGKAVLLFWTREPIEFHIALLFGEPTEENVQTLLKSPFRGRAASTEFEANKFYMLALSGSGGRAVVRDWIETSLGDAQKHLRDYFIGQHVVGGREPYQKLIALAGATVRDLDQLAPWVPLALVEHALKGSLLPISLLSTAVRRCVIGKVNPGTRKREHVNAQQAALIKLCLRSWNQQHNNEVSEDWMTKLDLQCEEPAYLYGRLFNVLEQVQEGATGGDSVERTFGTAVMSPVSTLPRLIVRSTVHLRKLKRDKPGLAVNLGKLMNEIQGKIGTKHAYLTRLNAEQQGLFVLGYWHQNAARYEKHTDSDSKEQ